MEKESKFFTQIHRDLLKLVNYHKQVINENHTAGIIDKDDDVRLHILNGIPELVNQNILAKTNFEKKKQEEKEKLLLLRQHADCPHCKIQQQVKIMKQTTNKKFGWKMDVVKCRKCKTVFTNYMPNNWSDRVKFAENFYSKMFEVRKEDDKTIAEILEVNGVAEQKEMENFLTFQKAQLEVEKLEQQQIEAIKQADQSLVVMHDFLLAAKINRFNWNIPHQIN